jgi:anti-anti-sigma factor
MRSTAHAGAVAGAREPLRVERVVDGRLVLVRVGGELDTVTVGTLHDALVEAETCVTPPVPVVVDLTGVTFLGAAGLSVLVDHHERCAALGSALLIVPGGNAVRRAMAVTGLQTRLALIPAPR